MKAGGFCPMGTLLEIRIFASMPNLWVFLACAWRTHPRQLNSALSTAFAHEGPAVIECGLRQEAL